MIQYWSSAIEKQVGARVQMVLEDPMLIRLLQEFGPDVFRRSSVFHGLARLLDERKIRGRLCFEIGTWNALTAAVLSRYFDQVVTVDIAHNADRFEILDFLGIKNVRCIDISSNEHKAEVAQDLRFDFAYMDGDHAHDTAGDWSIVRGCGRVLLHECWPWQPDVWDLVHSLPPDEVTHNGLGLALWEAPR